MDKENTTTQAPEQSQTNAQPAQAAQEDISVKALREYYEARERDTAAQMEALRRTLAEREETIHVLMGDRPDAKAQTTSDAFYQRIGLKRRD